MTTSRSEMTTSRSDIAPGRRSAVFSPCRRYRYRLGRVWGLRGRVLWVLLNPSTADETVDDPTVRRVWAFSASWGYGAAEVCNLFAWRSTDPRALRAVGDPVGPDNDAHLLAAAAEADLVMCGWGAHGAVLGRGEAVVSLLRGAGHALSALGLTRAGEPRHPLYVPGRARPVPFRVAPVAPAAPGVGGLGG